MYCIGQTIKVVIVVIPLYDATICGTGNVPQHQRQTDIETDRQLPWHHHALRSSMMIVDQGVGKGIII